MSESQDHAPCPVCGTELELESPTDNGGVCPMCGEATLHEDGEIIRHPEYAKGVEEHEIELTITINSYGTEREYALNSEKDNLKRLLTGGRNTWQYSEDRVNISEES